MSPTRREALAQLSALLAVPLVRWPDCVADPLGGTIVEYQAGRLRGDWTAASCTALAIARCEEWGRELRAIDLMAPTALDEARASDERLRRGALRGPLDGVPLFAKSIYDMRGLPTTASSRAWAELFPDAATRDALEVTRLREAGAVLLGKTAADDFAYRGNGTSSLTGQVRNPHDPTGVRTPGGSSAGAAVVVACGMAFAALGTDDGGSNRIPAQFTGVVGVKPTFGLVPRTGVVPTWPYLDTHGPLARTVADAALMLDAIAGPDASDGLALRTPWTRGALGEAALGKAALGEAALRDDALANVRLGLVALHAPRDRMSVESLAAFDGAIADCIAAGAIVEPCMPAVDRATVQARFADAARARNDTTPNAKAKAAAPTVNALFRYFADRGDADPRAQVQRGLAAFRAFYDVIPETWDEVAPLLDRPYEQEASARSFARSRETVVAALAESMRAQRLDALVYPTMPFPAPAAADPWPDIRTALGFGNWLGLPEVSVPAGHGPDGMPAGNVSFVGLPGDDMRLIAMAHAYERHSRRFVLATRP